MTQIDIIRTYIFKHTPARRAPWRIGVYAYAYELLASVDARTVYATPEALCAAMCRSYAASGFTPAQIRTRLTDARPTARLPRNFATWREAEAAAIREAEAMIYAAFVFTRPVEAPHN